MIHYETVYDLIREMRVKASDDEWDVEQTLNALERELHEIENED